MTTRGHLLCAGGLWLPLLFSPLHALAQEEAGQGYGASARVRSTAAGEKEITLRETREMAGTLGDPFRVVDSLPGVTPMASGLPYFYVRGSPPATVGYYYDDIPIPLLYHFALGPSAIHPRMLGPIAFYAGVSPARFGRRLGASLSADGPRAGASATGEAELRLLDVNGYIRAPIGDATVQVAGRYGYPGLLLSAISPGADLDYWDYQTRLDLPLGDGSQLQAIALGSFDRLSNPPWGEEDDRFTEVDLQFHRLELRLLKRQGSAEIGSALRVGYDESSLDRELAVKALTVAPRLWVKLRPTSTLRLHVGADMQGSIGDIESITQSAPLQVGGRRQIRVDVPFYADAPARNAGGTFAQMRLRPNRSWTLDLGARWDVWLVSGNVETAVDPRLRASFDASDEVRLHAAFGLAHQPAVFMFPLPGLTEVALDRGLQEALQSEAGVELQLPGDLSLESQLFLHYYDGLLLPEMYAPDEGQSAPAVDAYSYGAEFFLKRASRHPLSGWISYTLGWARAHPPGGESFAPEFDVRHVLNLVLQYRFDFGLSFGTRAQVRSGRPFNQFDISKTPTYELRLPRFARIDARVGYDFDVGWALMHVYAEWLNLTLAEEALGAECFYGTCQMQRAPAIFFPNVGLRAEF